MEGVLVSGEAKHTVATDRAMQIYNCLEQLRQLLICIAWPVAMLSFVTGAGRQEPLNMTGIYHTAVIKWLYLSHCSYKMTLFITLQL